MLLADTLERVTMRKVFLHIVPFQFLVFTIGFLDRQNISFAALEMGRDFTLTSEAFGFAAGIFYIGYVICQVPSNIGLRRFGSRAWLSSIQLSWGIIVCASAFAQTANQFYVARFLLGVAQAGLIPGLIAYFNYWFPIRHLAKPGAILGAAVPVAYLIAGPLSALLMGHVSLFGLHGWRAMVFFEGVPAIITGLISWRVLTDGPENATWLTAAERTWLVQEMKDKPGEAPLAELPLAKIFTDPKILYLGLIYLLFHFGSSGLSFWMPQLLKATNSALTNSHVGWLSAIPFAVATLGLYFWAGNSDRTGERRLHSALALLLAGTGLAASVLSRDALLPSMILLSLSLTGFYSFKAPFNVLPRLFLARNTAVVAFAYIEAIGNIGNFGGPFIFGLIKSRTHDTQAGLLTLAGLSLIGCVLTLCLRLTPRRSPCSTLHGGEQPLSAQTSPLPGAAACTSLPQGEMK